ncbi:MAG: VCBS repeat-containing protein, partial [Planctomycetota bacterium]|nr:VCBS repeat-containing protein [Planctomycetota bacterium]
PAVGPKGWLMPWKSQTVGEGFVAVMPLAPKPVAFIAVKNGAPATPALSAAASGKWIGGAVVARSDAAGGRRLVLLAGEKSSEIVTMAERDGRFESDPKEPPLQVDALAQAMATGDWNLDGLDDLVLVMRDSVRLYFRTPEGFEPGPVYDGLGTLEGTVGVADLNSDGRPDVMVVTEGCKAKLLLSRINTGATPPAPEEKPAAELKLGDWPDLALLKDVELGERIRVEGAGTIQVPKGIKPMAEPLPDSLITASNCTEATFQKDPEMMFVDIKRLEKEIPDNLHLVLGPQLLKALEDEDANAKLVQNPNWGKIGENKALRAEFTARAKILPEANEQRNAIYWIKYPGYTLIVKVGCRSSTWSKNARALEACVRTLKPE